MAAGRFAARRRCTTHRSHRNPPQERPTKTTNIIRPLVTVAALAAAAGSASAQRAVKTTGSATLKAAAKISDDSARRVAMASVPGASLRSAELEREHGRLIYSFDMKVAGQSGTEEVNVDAMTGKVVAHEHETAKHEAREAAAEKQKGTKAARP